MSNEQPPSDPRHQNSDYLKYSEDGYCDIELSRAVTLGSGVEIRTLRMREPTVDDQVRHEEAQGGEGAKEIATMAHLCELAPEDIRRLPLKSYSRLQEGYQGFLL